MIWILTVSLGVVLCIYIYIVLKFIAIWAQDCSLRSIQCRLLLLLAIGGAKRVRFLGLCHTRLGRFKISKQPYSQLCILYLSAQPCGIAISLLLSRCWNLERSRFTPCSAKPKQIGGVCMFFDKPIERVYVKKLNLPTHPAVNLDKCLRMWRSATGKGSD